MSLRFAAIITGLREIRCDGASRHVYCGGGAAVAGWQDWRRLRGLGIEESGLSEASPNWD
jgi:hypothetical protein